MNQPIEYSRGVYQEYLAWVKSKEATPEGVKDLIDRNAGLIKREEGKDPVWQGPYGFNLWYIMDANSGCDFKIMEERARQIKQRNRWKINQALQHVGGNPNNPLLNDEYLERAKTTKDLLARYAGYAAGSKAAAHDIIKSLKDESGDLLNLAPQKPSTPIGKPKQSLWSRIKSKFKRRVKTQFGDPTHESMSYAEKQELWKDLK